MEWTDEGIVLSARRHGETSSVVTLFTRTHGRHAGLVRGGAGRKAAGMLQPGNLVAALWRARLEDHLGSYSCDLTEPYAARVLDDPLRLAAVASACALLDLTLPEREPHPLLYAVLDHLLANLSHPHWAEAYVRWEVLLLAELGFGLDLGTCAATGANDGLIYVSPRSGRAVSASAGEPFRDRLLALPGFLVARDAVPDAQAGDRPDRGGLADSVADPAAHTVLPTSEDLRLGLRLTGYFLVNRVLGPMDRGMPMTRSRLPDLLAADRAPR